MTKAQVRRRCVALPGAAMVLTQGLRQLGELVNVFAGVAAVGDAEAEVEVKALEQVFAEVVPLDHAEVVQGSTSHRELYTVRFDGEGDRERKGLRQK